LLSLLLESFECSWWEKIRDLLSCVRETTDKCNEVHSHRYLPEIFNLLWHPDSPIKHIAPRGSFNDLVFRIVFFHQSTIVFRHLAPKAHLDISERFLYLDPLMLKIMLPFQIGDNCGYQSMWKKERGSFEKAELFLTAKYLNEEW